MKTANLILKASAGTGKTFSLTTRIIQLLAPKTRNGEPASISLSNILALTFSKAAAFEIYAKLVDRLANAASSPKKTNETNQQLDIPSLEQKDYCDLLRRVISTQYIDNIATIDSFILRMIQYFPLQLGYLGGAEIIDDYDHDEAIQKTVDDVLSAQETLALEERIKELDNETSQRSFYKRLKTLIETYQDPIRIHSDLLDCTVEEICITLGIDPNALHATTHNLKNLIESNEVLLTCKGIIEFIAHYTDWNIYKALLPTSGEGKKFVSALLEKPEEASKYTYYSKEHIFFNSVREAALTDIKIAFDKTLYEAVRKQLLSFKLVHTIDQAYHQQTRKHGRLTFNDLPWALYERAQRDDLLQSLEYHFDSTFDHWALDEFQDTSISQWACLKNLVLNAAEDQEDRTVTIVGDLKQAIYAWRGGDERLFSHLMQHPLFNAPYGQVRNLATSYRYGKHTCDLVNLIFGKENMTALEHQLTHAPNAIQDWLKDACWMLHEPEYKNGTPVDHDFIRIIEIPKEDPTDTASLFYYQLCQEIKALWQLRTPLLKANRIPKETVAVLVRDNKQGEAIAAELRRAGLPAIWEGESAICDLPAIHALLALLKLAQHPDDTLAWGHCCHSPIRNILCPQCETIEQASQWVSTQLTTLGLTRTLMAWVSECLKPTNRLDELSRQRLFDLVTITNTFEQRQHANQTIDDFLKFLNHQTIRDAAKDPSVIRILTIHRSKGLGFDHVFLPIQEHRGIMSPHPTPYYNTQEPGDETPWTIDNFPKDILPLYPALQAAYEKRVTDNVLATIHNAYVAMTRSKKSLTILMKQTSKDNKSSTLYFSSIIKHACAKQFTPAKEDDYILLYQAGNRPTTMASDPASTTTQTFQRHTSATTTPTLQRFLPSRNKASDIDIAQLFSASYSHAAQRGTDIHDQYATIQWITPGKPKTNLEARILRSPLKEAFIIPEGPVELWVEYGYDRINNNQWETGRFDRVVIQGSGDNRRATIYDIKSNRRPKDTTVDDFHTTMAATYSSQMHSYRQALSALLGLPPTAIRTQLILLSTQTLLTLHPFNS